MHIWMERKYFLLKDSKPSAIWQNCAGPVYVFPSIDIHKIQLWDDASLWVRTVTDYSFLENWKYKPNISD